MPKRSHNYNYRTYRIPADLYPVLRDCIYAQDWEQAEKVWQNIADTLGCVRSTIIGFRGMVNEFRAMEKIKGYRVSPFDYERMNRPHEWQEADVFVPTYGTWAANLPSPVPVAPSANEYAEK